MTHLRYRPASNKMISIRRAFTMLELLIVMSIIIVLIALLAPTLHPVRVKADLTKELSTQHQLLAALNLYASDSRQYFPYFATPGDPSGPIRVRDFDLAQQGKPYFRTQAGYWPSIVVPRYLSSKIGLLFKPMGREPQNSLWPDYIIPTDYFLSHTVHAAPQYWVGDDPPENLGLLRGTTWDQVRYPSNKTILLQMIAADGPKGGPDPKIDYFDTTVGLADGSTKIVFYPPPEDFESNIVSRPFGALPFPSLSTRNGLEGRDY